MSPVTRQRRFITVQVLFAAFVGAWMGAVSAEQAPAGAEALSTAEMEAALPADESLSTGSETQAEVVFAARLGALNEALSAHQMQGRDEQALQTAREIAALIEDQHGSSAQLLKPLSTIADLELELGDAAAAEQTLRRLVALIEQQDSVFSTELVEPLTELAKLHAATDRKEDAITLLRRARHITHRRFGILNMEQKELADLLVDNYFRMGKISEGSRESRFAYRVNVNEFGADSAELVPATNALAAWYERIGEFAVARRYLKQSIALIEKNFGEDDLRMVDTLQRVAQTYKKQGAYKSEGQKALLKAIEIYENHPEADEVGYARSLTDLADWQLATLRTRDAMENYRRVWNMLTDDGANPEKGNEFFKKPKRLRYAAPIPTASRMLSVAEVYVDVELVVNPDGTARDISVTDSNADWRTQGEVRAAMRSARFRPKFVDGEPVQTRIANRWTYVVPDSLRRRDVVKETADEGVKETG